MPPAPLDRAESRPDLRWLGFSLMAVGMALLPFGDGFGKLLSERAPYPPETLAWIRFGSVSLTLIPVLALFAGRTPMGFVRTRFFWGSQILRGVLIAATVGLILAAVAREPMAEVAGAFFIAPLVSTALAAVWLRERVGRARLALLALGGAGVALVVGPSGLTVGLLLALASGLVYGVFLTVTRWSAGAGPPLAMLTVQFVVAALVLTPIAAGPALSIGVVEPTLLALMAFPSLGANLLTLIAYRYATAVALAPIVYLQLLSAALTGYGLFGDVPGVQAAIGLAVIAASGVAAAAPQIRRAP